MAESTNITNALNVTNLNTTAEVNGFGTSLYRPEIQPLAHAISG